MRSWEYKAAMKEMSLSKMTEMVLKFRQERDWAQFHTAKELAISLVVESAELLEIMQWRQGAQLQEAIEKRKEEIADELGDVLHSVLLIAHDLGIDLSDAFVQKLRKAGEKYPIEKAKGKAAKYHEL